MQIHFFTGDPLIFLNVELATQSLAKFGKSWRGASCLHVHITSVIHSITFCTLSCNARQTVLVCLTSVTSQCAKEGNGLRDARDVHVQTTCTPP